MKRERWRTCSKARLVTRMRGHTLDVASRTSESTSRVTSHASASALGVRAHAPTAQVTMSASNAASQLLSLASWACFQCKFELAVGEAATSTSCCVSRLRTSGLRSLKCRYQHDKSFFFFAHVFTSTSLFRAIDASGGDVTCLSVTLAYVSAHAQCNSFGVVAA